MKMLFLICVLMASALHAATFTVTSLTDSGAGTLRDAVTQANAAAGADDIVFATTINLPGTITLQTALPDITDDLTITGPASNDLILRRNTAAAAFRIFTIPAATVEISHLWMLDGRVAGTAGTSAEGGCIRHAGNLVIRDCVIANCNAVGFDGGTTLNGEDGAGGAIFSAGDLTLDGVAIVDCAATGGGTSFAMALAGDGRGGAVIHTSGLMILRNSQLSDCTAQAGDSIGGGGIDGTAEGGAIFATASVYLFDSDVSGCATLGATAVVDGGALNVSGGNVLFRSSVRNSVGVAIRKTGPLFMQNCTLSSNQGVDHGGLWLDSTGFTSTLEYCTIHLNSGAVAGGIELTGGALELEGCIVAGNTGPAPDASGTFSDLDNNLIGDDTGSTGFTVSLLVGDMLNPITPGLGALQAMGSFTWGHAPVWGSFAIDRGGSGAPIDDQRGANRLFGGIPDIGAIEFITNQQPDFTAGGSVSEKTDGDTRVVSAWAGNITAGAPWESGQTLTFFVTGSRTAFKDGPSINSTTGDLTFRPKEGESGTHFFNVYLVDNGGTANGGDDTSTTRTLVIKLIDGGKGDDEDLQCAAKPGAAHWPLGLLLVIAGALWLRRRKISGGAKATVVDL
ncbi:MAG: right-handed parallel beta-helix repeat-containing protein [Planctomycetes bacterium]|nr:right-handed parallel beta-helix repeat-containing protein [Planctomycetota bacterium]